jgi:DNA-binding transcriptional LysR family regulator
MFPNVTLIQIRCFRGVAERGSFTAAAEHLCLSQSAVSQAVAGLEKSLGVALLVRGREGVTLTSAGAAALQEARAVLASVERFAASVRTARSISGSLHLGVVQSAAIRLLPNWMRQLRAIHPEIKIVLYEGTDPEVTGWVEAGAVEVGFTSRTQAALTAMPVFEDDYVVIVPEQHELAGRTSVSLKELDGKRMLLSGGGCETLVAELLAAASSNPEIACMVRDNATLISMVGAGLGFAIVPELAVPADHGGVVIIKLRPTMRRTLHAVTLGLDKISPAANALLGLIDGLARKPMDERRRAGMVAFRSD